MRFDPSRFGLRHQLLGLFGLFLVTGALVLTLDEIGQHTTQRSMAAMKDDVLAGMGRMRRLGDAYAQDVVDTTFRTRNHLIGWEQGQAVVAAARATTAQEWHALQALPLEGEDKALLEQALQARVRADQAAETLQRILQAKDIRALGQIADLRQVVLEVGRRTVGGDRICVRVQLVEDEAVRIALVLPEIVAQIARFGTARL